MELHFSIHNIRNIKEATIDLPFERGMYAIVGENGCGKSTFMLLFSLIVKPSSARLISTKDLSADSFVVIKTETCEDCWVPDKNSLLATGKIKKGSYGRQVNTQDIYLRGFYEGSIFYGTRFNDYNKVSEFLNNPNFNEHLIPADPFVSETLGFILHNDKSYYASLKKIKTKAIAKSIGFAGIPYFYEINDKVISQYQMSSGESMLISLIDFINNMVKRQTYSQILFLIDEVEIALHPAAIDRLFLFLDGLIKNEKSEIIVYFSTHSSELIHRIAPKNIFLLENNRGTIESINPCYPNYAIRSLYIPNGFDFLLLVEDELAKGIVDKAIKENNLASSRLCCVLPAGGCTQMLKLHHDMITYNTLGVGKRIISIFDGDVKDNIMQKEEYRDLPKCFLPIPSVEKYLKAKLIDNPDRAFMKLIGDKYFNQRSLSDIIKDYLSDPRTTNSKDNNGKILYSILCSNLSKIGLSENDFIRYISDDIYSYENPVRFVESLRKMLS